MLVDADLVELEEAAGGFGDHIQQVRHAVLVNLKVGVIHFLFQDSPYL